MVVYLASPNTQQQAEHAAGMPVLLSYAVYAPWHDKGYWRSWERRMIDSGAFSEFSGGKAIDLQEYKDWSEPRVIEVDAVAGLDDIAGDWKKSIHNYEAIPWSFPVWHETDPRELLPELVSMAKERNSWIGIGLIPPRSGKESVVRWACDNIPESIHVHGFALREYTYIARLDSVDSTNWWRDGMMLRTNMPWLSYGECLELVIKRYQRWDRPKDNQSNTKQMELWTSPPSSQTVHSSSKSSKTRAAS